MHGPARAVTNNFGAIRYFERIAIGRVKQQCGPANLALKSHLLPSSLEIWQQQKEGGQISIENIAARHSKDINAVVASKNT
eukprot:4880663-Pleurochrysis_carterae.AAC.2